MRQLLLAVAMLLACRASAEALSTYAWRAETTRPAPVTITLLQGESLTLEATLTERSKAISPPDDATSRFFWRDADDTSADFWSASASLSGNVLSFTWTPSQDTGKSRYEFYLSIESDSAGTLYRAFGILVMQASPGFDPAQLDDPDILQEVADRTAERALAQLEANFATNEALAEETSRATTAEEALATDLATEVARAKAAESTLTSDLASEVARAKAAEATLTTNIAANATAISTETSRAQAAEEALETTLATKADSTALEDYLPLAGGTATGKISAPILEATNYFVARKLVNETSAPLNHAMNLGYNSHDYAEFREYGSDFRFYGGGSNTPTMIARITGSGIYENGTLLSAKYAPISHTHAIADVADLQTTLDAKALASDLTAEVSRATAAEEANATAIEAEATRATTAEATLTTNLAAEVTRAKAAEEANAANITTNATAIATETSRAQAAEAALQTAIDTKADASDLADYVTLGTEQTIAGDKTTTGQFTFDGALLANTDLYFTEGYGPVYLNADNSDSFFTMRVDDSLMTYGPDGGNLVFVPPTAQVGDWQAYGQVSVPTPTASAHATTKSYVDGLIATATASITANATAIQTNADAIAAETTRATAAETTLSTNLTAEATRAKAAEETLTTNLASATIAIQTNADAISAETTRAQTAEATLTSDLAAETSRATAAEEANAANISTNATAIQTNADAIAAETSRATAAEEALQLSLDSKADSSTLTSYLPLSGGTLTGQLFVGQDALAQANRSYGDVIMVTGGPTNGRLIFKEGGWQDSSAIYMINNEVANTGDANKLHISTATGGTGTSVPTSYTPRITVLYSSGNVGIGTTSPSYKLQVAGTAYATAFNEAGTLLSAKYAPLSHTHTVSEVTDFPSTWSYSALTDVPSTFTPSAHTHTVSEVTDFPTTWSYSALTDVPTSFTPSAHTHAISEVTNLQTTLDAKALASDLSAEVTRATAAEEANAANITANATAIATETSRATAAEEALDAKLATVIDGATYYWVWDATAQTHALTLNGATPEYTTTEETTETTNE